MSDSADAPGGSFPDRWAMTYITSTQIAGATLAGYQALLAALPATEPDGLLARYAGITGDTLVITAVWASKAHYDRFTTELLVPTLRSMGSLPGASSSRTVEYEAVDQFVGVRA
jgi:hypothetical protein